jgi:hypothetical protein
MMPIKEKLIKELVEVAERQMPLQVFNQLGQLRPVARLDTLGRIKQRLLRQVRQRFIEGATRSSGGLTTAR